MKKLFIFVFVIVGLVGSLVFYYTSGKPAASSISDTKQTRATSSNNNSNEVPTTEEGKASLVDLLNRNANLECSIVHETDTVVSEQVEGTYFTSRGRLRADLVLAEQVTPQLTSIIMKDDWLYVWTEVMGEKYGMKMSWQKLAEVESNPDIPQANTSVPFYSPVNYSCSPWLVVDGSIFEPPSDILFKDYETIVGGGMEMGTIYEDGSLPTTDPCSVCAQVPAGPGRDECLTRFACPIN